MESPYPLLPYSQANTAMAAHAQRRGYTLVPIKLTMGFLPFSVTSKNTQFSNSLFVSQGFFWRISVSRKVRKKACVCLHTHRRNIRDLFYCNTLNFQPSNSSKFKQKALWNIMVKDMIFFLITGLRKKNFKFQWHFLKAATVVILKHCNWIEMAKF